MVHAATKKFSKATSKAKSVGKNVAKSVKRNVPSKPKKAISKGDSWYGPDRALFLGKLQFLNPSTWVTI